MKNLFTLFLLCFISFSAFAQGFQIKKIYMERAMQQDMVDGLSYQYFTDRLPSETRASLKYADMEKGYYYGGVCENPAINFGLTLTHDKFKNFEWRNGFSYMPNRVDGVSYYDYNDNYGGDFVNVNARHDELAIESSLNYKFSPLSFLHFYGGVGANMGVTYNNEMCYYTSIEPSTDELTFRNAGDVNEEVSNSGYEYYEESDCFNGGNDFTQRIFISGGVAVSLFNKGEIGFDIKRGLGNRTNFDGSTIQTNFNSVSLRAAFILN